MDKVHKPSDSEKLIWNYEFPIGDIQQFPITYLAVPGMFFFSLPKQKCVQYMTFIKKETHISISCNVWVWISVSHTKRRIWYWGKATGSWIKLHKKIFHNLHSWPNIILLINLKNVWRVGHVACVGEKRNTYRVSVWKPERKRPILEGEDNIKMVPKDTMRRFPLDLS